MPDRTSAPHLNDVLSITRPEPDSHFRLTPCECGSDNVAYIKFTALQGESYRVSCLDCGKTVSICGIASRHDVQIRWNRVEEVAYA